MGCEEAHPLIDQSSKYRGNRGIGFVPWILMIPVYQLRGERWELFVEFVGVPER